jgi:tetratricopeptide (TPR) repeat protein
VLVYLLHASVDWMWESTAATVFALAGVAVVGGRLARSRPRLTLPLRAALVAVAAGAALVQLPGMISTTAVRNSQVADRAGDLARALQLARDAVTAEPWSASAHEQEALVLEQGGQLRQARKQESIAISDEPTNYAHWLIRSRIETELGQLSLAIRSYDRAYQLRPYSAIFAYAPYFKTR